MNLQIVFAHTNLSYDCIVANLGYRISIISVVFSFGLCDSEFPINHLIVNQSVVSVEDRLRAAHPVKSGIDHLRTGWVAAVFLWERQLGGGGVHRGGISVDIDIFHGTDSVSYLTRVVVAIRTCIRVQNEVCVSQYGEVSLDGIGGLVW